MWLLAQINIYLGMRMRESSPIVIMRNVVENLDAFKEYYEKTLLIRLVS